MLMVQWLGFSLKGADAAAVSGSVLTRPMLFSWESLVQWCPCFVLMVQWLGFSLKGADAVAASSSVCFVLMVQWLGISPKGADAVVVSGSLFLFAAWCDGVHVLC